MKNRILTTLILWALVIVLPYFLGNLGAFILIGLLAVGSFYEFLDLMDRAGRTVDRMISLGAFICLLLAFMVFPPSSVLPIAIIAIIFVFIMVASFLNSEMGSFSATVAATIGSVFILGIPFVCTILLVHEFGIMLLVWVVAVMKFADAGALMTGMWIGKHKMAPALSPKKTWEGLAGGVVVSIAVSVLFVITFKQYLPAELTVVWSTVLALLITLSGVLSDLMESALKREAEVKDSGNLIPGIGGFLDLTDSVLLALPVSYFLIWLLV